MHRHATILMVALFVCDIDWKHLPNFVLQYLYRIICMHSIDMELNATSSCPCITACILKTSVPREVFTYCLRIK